MDRPHEMVLRLSARQENWLIARMALSGLGMLAGLDADLIGDLQTAVNECCDCLLHQTTTPETLVLRLLRACTTVTTSCRSRTLLTRTSTRQREKVSSFVKTGWRM